MIGAFRAGKQNTTFNSTAGGFVPFRGSRSITDANGGCEPPYGCGTLNIIQAFEASSNQYFAQMAVDLGKERIRETAGAFSILAVENPEEALQAGFFPGIWNASNSRISNALAPQQSTIVTGKDISAYDVGLEGMGQGYAGQMTPFQMALVAAAPANMEGKLMKAESSWI
jgi:cell division protein FtsI/penicillin-binding protein 2